MDIALLRWLFAAVIEATDILSRDAGFAAQCRERLDHLPLYPMRDGALVDMESKEFVYSHRHNGMLTPIYPCADLAGRAAVKTVNRFLARGKWLWGCHSVPWQAAACARLGHGEEAGDLLAEMFESYFLPSGGFNLNYNYQRRLDGIAGPPVFCNESNSGFSAALLEMLLQSHNGILQVFPALPRRWKNAAFDRLRAEGALLVSATRRNGRTTEVVIRSERGGTVRVKSPWGNGMIRLSMTRGQTARLTP